MSLKKTKTQQLLDAIPKEGSIRTPELSQATGIERANIRALLDHPIKNGDVVVCKVMIPGKPDQNEYRRGPGVPPMPIPPELKPGKRGVQFSRGAVGNGIPPAPIAADKTIINPFDDELAPTRGISKTKTSKHNTQPAVVSNTGSARFDPPHGNTPAKAPAVAKTSVQALVAPAPRGDDINDFKIVIDQDGAISCYDSTGFTVDFTPAQTLALGDFLHCCETLWRP